MNLDFLKTKMTKALAAKYFLLKKGIPRSLLAMRYLKGEGLEIGALHNPVVVGPRAKSRFLDRMSVEDLVQEYPELEGLKLVKPDIIDNGEELSKVFDVSQDFIIANHFIEHCENPIQTLFNFVEKLKLGGRLFLAVPDKRYTFDIKRPSTSFDHLVKDFEEGPDQSREGHYTEWCSMVEVSSRAQDLMERSYSIHFHVWNRFEFLEFLESTINKFGLPLKVLSSLSTSDEALFILEKGAGPSVTGKNKQLV